jgi:hypothetical protein
MEVSKLRQKASKRVQSSKPFYRYGLNSNMYSSNPRERDTRLNLQRRQKLTMTIVEQLIEKLNVHKDRNIVQREVENLMKKEIINDRDLKTLEKKIIQKIKEKNDKETLKQNLIKANSNQGFIEEKKLRGDNAIPNDENANEELNRSDMSGASDLDKFDEKSKKQREREEKMGKYKDCKCFKLRPTRPKVEINFDQYKNEWDAINMYKIQKEEERERNEKIKNWENKMRTRADLNKQIKEKMKKEVEAELKSKEFDLIMDKHYAHLDELEKEKQKLIKVRAMKEKELRDKQIKESDINKRINKLKDKLYEKELIRHTKEEIKNAEQKFQEKRRLEKEELAKTLKDNELHKKLEKEKLIKEREEDIKMMQDSIAADIKKDNERKAYFNRIERSGNVFAQNAIENILKKREEKLKQDEEKINKYLAQKELKEQKEENDFYINKKKNQKMMRDFYDKQVEEKKQRELYEKNLDKIQAEIWKKDTDTFFAKEKEIKKTIRDFEKNNVKELDKQVKMGKYDVDKMTQFEKDYNYDLLQKANEMQQKAKKCCCYYD